MNYITVSWFAEFEQVQTKCNSTWKVPHSDSIWSLTVFVRSIVFFFFFLFILNQKKRIRRWWDFCRAQFLPQLHEGFQKSLYISGVWSNCLLIPVLILNPFLSLSLPFPASLSPYIALLFFNLSEMSLFKIWIIECSSFSKLACRKSYHSFSQVPPGVGHALPQLTTTTELQLTELISGFCHMELTHNQTHQMPNTIKANEVQFHERKCVSTDYDMVRNTKYRLHNKKKKERKNTGGASFFRGVWGLSYQTFQEAHVQRRHASWCSEQLRAKSTRSARKKKIEKENETESRRWRKLADAELLALTVDFVLGLGRLWVCPARSLVGWNFRLSRLCTARKTIRSLELDFFRLTKRLDWDVQFAVLRTHGFEFFQPASTSSPGVNIANLEDLQADEYGENEGERKELHYCWRFLSWPDEARRRSDVRCSWVDRFETSATAFWRSLLLNQFVVGTVDVPRRRRRLVVRKSWFPHLQRGWKSTVGRKLALVGIIPHQIRFSFSSDKDTVEVLTAGLDSLKVENSHAVPVVASDPLFDSRRGCAVFFRLIRLSVFLSLSELKEKRIWFRLLVVGCGCVSHFEHCFKLFQISCGAIIFFLPFLCLCDFWKLTVDVVVSLGKSDLRNRFCFLLNRLVGLFEGHLSRILVPPADVRSARVADYQVVHAQGFDFSNCALSLHASCFVSGLQNVILCETRQSETVFDSHIIRLAG